MNIFRATFSICSSVGICFTFQEIFETRKRRLLFALYANLAFEIRIACVTFAVITNDALNKTMPTIRGIVNLDAIVFELENMTTLYE